jgi:hypothetical protein
MSIHTIVDEIIKSEAGQAFQQQTTHKSNFSAREIVTVSAITCSVLIMLFVLLACARYWWLICRSKMAPVSALMNLLSRKPKDSQPRLQPSVSYDA